jgi:hypothetical protein
VAWATFGSAVLVRIRLAQVFCKPGRLNNHRTFARAVVMTNEAATDGDQGPPRPTRSTFCWHKQQKGEHMEIRPGRAPGEPSPAPSRGPLRRCAACCSLPQKVERIGRKADGDPRPLRSTHPRGAARAPAQPPSSPSPGPRPPNHPPHPAPGPDRATANRPPKPGGPRAPGGWGPRLVRRELGSLARAGLSRPPTSSFGRVLGDIVDVVAEHHGVAAVPQRSLPTRAFRRDMPATCRGLDTFRPYIRRFVTNPPRDGAARS